MQDPLPTESDEDTSEEEAEEARHKVSAVGRDAVTPNRPIFFMVLTLIPRGGALLADVAGQTPRSFGGARDELSVLFGGFVVK
jgi:hypothetical protein